MSKIKINISANIVLPQSEINRVVSQARNEFKKHNLTIQPTLSNITKKNINEIIKNCNSVIKNNNIVVKIPTKLVLQSVKGDLKSIASQIKNANDLKLVVGLDVERSKNKIQAQLTKLITGATKQLTVDLTADTKTKKKISTSTVTNVSDSDDLGTIMTKEEINAQKALNKSILDNKNLLDSIIKQRQKVLDLTEEEKIAEAELRTAIASAESKEESKQVTTQINDFEKTINSSLNTQEAINTVNNLRTSLEKLDNPIIEADKKVDELEASLQSLQASQSKAGVSPNTIIGEGAASWNTQAAQVSEQINQALIKQQELLNFNHKKSNLSNDTLSWMRAHERAAKQYGSQLRELLNQINGLDDVDYTKLRNIENQIKGIKKTAQAEGLLTENIFTRMKKNISKFIQWYGGSNLVMKAIQVGKQIVAEVTKIDTAMTNLRKVSDASDSALSRFLDNAYDRAKRLGSTVNDLIDATAEFSRLGYNLEDSAMLGEAATIYTNVGDGITATEASQSLISTLKAFGIEAEDVMSVVDRFNEVGKFVPKYIVICRGNPVSSYIG